MVTTRMAALRESIEASVRFRLSQLICERVELKPFPCRLDRGLVSFTFDDFPDSAHKEGGKVLEAHGVRGTYYAACGMMAGEGAAVSERVAKVARSGHEIGCHTYSHLDCVTTDEGTLVRDIERNARAIEEAVGSGAPVHFAFPYGRVGRAIKRRLAGHFQTCRGIFPGVNVSPVDLSLLRANKLYGGSRNLERGGQLIAQVARSGGWVIFFTHDVSQAPSKYGCTPQELEEMVSLAVRSGCAVVTVGQALAALGYKGDGWPS